MSERLKLADNRKLDKLPTFKESDKDCDMYSLFFKKRAYGQWKEEQLERCICINSKAGIGDIDFECLRPIMAETLSLRCRAEMPCLLVLPML
jgi:hypothetical protein